MPERTFSSPEYRYGFNGKEKDESGEWGDLTHYDYGFRIYNPGVGRFLSVDPLTRSYSMLTPYQFASNGPIENIDLDGLESYRAYGDELSPEAYITVNLIRDAGLGLNNVGLVLAELSLVDWNEGHWLVKPVLQKAGHDVSGFSNRELGSAFSVRAERRYDGNHLVVVPDEGVLGTLATILSSSLDIAAVTPVKGGPLIATMKPFVANSVSDILRALRINKRTQEIKEFIDPASKNGKKTLNEFEAESGAILEDFLGITLRETKKIDGDFEIAKGTGKFSSGKTIDQMGVPQKALDSGNFKLSEFTASLKAHLNKSSDFILLDIRKLDDAQKAKVNAYIEVFLSNKIDKLIKIQ